MAIRVAPLSSVRAAPRGARRLLPWPRLRRIVWLGAALLALAVVNEIVTIRKLAREIGPVVESELWTFPSRIYARPLVLRPGLPLAPEELVARLKRLGYTESSDSPRRPHEFRPRGREIELYTASVELPDGEVPGRAARVSFRKGGTVAAIRDPSGVALADLVLEPELLATLAGDGAEDRTVLPLAAFPDHLIRAVVVAEDRRFFRHRGVDPLSVLRALSVNLRRGGIVQGGSTITQQTIKNLFLGSERTWSRKLEEARMALALETLIPKERILEIYLNEVYLGQRNGVAVCGLGEASRHYLGKEPLDLDLSEAALLAGLIRAPIATNPFRHLERALGRRNAVLAAMHDRRQISEAEYRVALAATPALTEVGARPSVPLLVESIRKQLAQRYPPQRIAHGGLRIHTTLDPQLQSLAEHALRRGLAALEASYPWLRQRGGRSLEAALVALDPRNGEILALVGGRDFSRNQFDHALLARRPPGSLFKPLVYLAGFEQAERDPQFVFTPATLLDDSPLVIAAADGTWAPQNYDEEFRGWVTVRRALEESINIPAVRASQQIGLSTVAAVARRCGLGLDGAVYPSLALGAAQATPLDMARAYATIANGGHAVEPTALRGIVERTGAVLERSSAAPRRVVSATAAYLTLDLLRGVLDRGTGQGVRGAGVRGDFAGKTGTTNDKRDAWFIGFSPRLLATVWVGFDDNSPTGLAGAQAALPIWIDFIRSSAGPSAADSFPEPPGITHAWIDPYTGRLATERCPEVLDELFRAGTEPLEPCPAHAGEFTWPVGDPAATSRFIRRWERQVPQVRPDVNEARASPRLPAGATDGIAHSERSGRDHPPPGFLPPGEPTRTQARVSTR